MSDRLTDVKRTRSRPRSPRWAARRSRATHGSAIGMLLPAGDSRSMAPE